MVLIGKASTGERILGFVLFLVLGMCSILLGQFLCYLPYWWWLPNGQGLTEKELLEQHPSRAWLARLKSVAVAVSALPTIFFVFIAGLDGINDQPPLYRYVTMFLLPPTFFVGSYSSVGVIEMVAGLSLVVPFGHGGPGRERYIVSPRVRWAGVYRVLLAIVLLSAFYYFSHGAAWWA